MKKSNKMVEKKMKRMVYYYDGNRIEEFLIYAHSIFYKDEATLKKKA